MNLPFQITTINQRRVKIRDDGRRGLAIGDEALLFDMLQETLAVNQRQAADLERQAADMTKLSEEVDRLRGHSVGTERKAVKQR